MPRKKKVDFDEKITPMTEDALNLPIEEKNSVSEFGGEIEKEIPVEKSVEKNVEKCENITLAPTFKHVSTNTALVNVRTAPEGEVITTVKNGIKVMVEKEEGEWTKVVGYIKTALLN